MTGFGVGERSCATSSRGLIFIWVGVRGGPAEAVPFYKAIAGPLANGNSRSFDSAEIRFAQDDRWFGGGGDFARLRRVDCLSIWWGGCGTTEVVPCYKAFAGPLAKSNRRSFDSAEVRFAQDDRWFGGGGDFARLRRVD